MSIFGKKKEIKTYTFEQMVEIIKIKGLVDSCNEPWGFIPDKSILTKRLERMVHVEERWNNFVKENPELEKEMYVEFETLKMNKKMLMFRIENSGL